MKEKIKVLRKYTDMHVTETENRLRRVVVSEEKTQRIMYENRGRHNSVKTKGKGLNYGYGSITSSFLGAYSKKKQRRI